MMTNKVALGQMKRIEPRTVWPHEEQDFTPWLYENLDKLGEALGLELEAEERECNVGDFTVDIVAHELGSNRVVVIENQLEATDHKHLGQLLTYAAGKEAGVVVWISPEFRDEHREALDWLNREGGEGHPEFFGVELQVVQIDDSKPAVNLRPVAFPNDWTRDLNDRATGNISEKRQKYLAFFQGLLDDLREQKFSNAKKAQPQNWYTFSSGVRGYSYGASFANSGRLRVELYIDLQDAAENKAAFEKLQDEKERIEAEFGEPLTWEKLENRRACRISLYTDGSIDDSAEAFAGHRRWMTDKLILMKKVLGPRIG
jgi:uncharacterized protein DUF4268